MKLDCGRVSLDLSSPRIMGVLNRTPDSFSDGGDFFGQDVALDHAREMLEAGADIIDIGGESTRPGAQAVSEDQEMERVLPLVEALRRETDAILSVDTSKARVMQAAISAGADLINDVRGFSDPECVQVLADSRVAACVMHMQGEPRTMQANPQYREVVREVRGFLVNRASELEEAGVGRRRILIDPGFGFGKTLDHNLTMLRELGAFCASGYPVLVGMSRKSMIGKVLDKGVDDRVHGSVAVATLAGWLGANIIRVHDVAATHDAIKMVAAVHASGKRET